MRCKIKNIFHDNLNMLFWERSCIINDYQAYFNLPVKYYNFTTESHFHLMYIYKYI